MKRVCVIGAGISGLVTAKTLSEEGYLVTVFEKQDGIGGVWEKSRTYPGLSTQNNRDTYAFSDYPMPASFPEWPTAEQMRTYLESYAQHFGFIDKIRFQTEVIKVERTPKQEGWLVSVKSKDSTGEKQEIHEFDFVMLCNGLFHTPQEPALPGREEFLASGGKILHSTKFSNPSLINGKRVIVVGFGKSALDIATLAVNCASETTLVFRQASWRVPKFFLNLINCKYIFLCRFAEAWLPYRKMSRLEQLLHSVGKPLVWVFWRINEILLRLQFGLDACGMVPDKPLPKSLQSGELALAPSNFYHYVRSGKIRALKTTITRFSSDGVELANGSFVKADVVIFATGFCQDIPFLEEKHRRLVIKEGKLNLYRNLIHPDIPQIGFVGYNTSLYSQLVSEVSAWWLAEYIKGNLTLPSSYKMYEEMLVDQNWREKEISSHKVSGTCISAFTLRYIEQLIQDMGVVKGHEPFWKRVENIMMPVDPSSYKYVRKELMSRRTTFVQDTRQIVALSMKNS